MGPVRWHATTLGYALGLAAVAHVNDASADPASARQADKLFKQASDALALKHYDEACPKLEESNRLERAVGTEYNLAVCYELSHKTASARRKYLDAAAFARQSGKETTAKEATERAKKLDLVVPRLVLRAPADRPAGATLRCDGQALDAEAWKKPVELDPGAHRVIVMADGFATFDKVVTLVESETTDLQVVFTPLAGGASSGAPAPAKPDPGADRGSTNDGAFPWKWVGLGAAAVGVVGLGAGGYFALHAKSGSDDSGCANGRTCPDEASADRLRSAKGDADLATVLFVAGGVLTVGGGLLFFLAPAPSAGASTSSATRPPPQGLHVRLSGAASRELTGLRLIGSF